MDNIFTYTEENIKNQCFVSKNLTITKNVVGVIKKRYYTVIIQLNNLKSFTNEEIYYTNAPVRINMREQSEIDKIDEICKECSPSTEDCDDCIYYENNDMNWNFEYKIKDKKAE